MGKSNLNVMFFSFTCIAKGETATLTTFMLKTFKTDLIRKLNSSGDNLFWHGYNGFHV